MMYEEQYMSAWLVAMAAFFVGILLFYRYIRWISIAEIRLWLLFAATILTFYPNRMLEPVEHVVPAFIAFAFAFVDSKFDFALSWPLLETPVYLIGFLGVILIPVGIIRKLMTRKQKASEDQERQEPDLLD
jgi:hypothetical protein